MNPRLAAGVVLLLAVACVIGWAVRFEGTPWIEPAANDTRTTAATAAADAADPTDAPVATAETTATMTRAAQSASTSRLPVMDAAHPVVVGRVVHASTGVTADVDLEIAGVRAIRVQTSVDGAFRLPLSAGYRGASTLVIGPPHPLIPVRRVLEIDSDEPHDIGVVVLDAGYFLTGVVHSDVGQPVADAAIRFDLSERRIPIPASGSVVLPATARTSSAAATSPDAVSTDAKGRFTIGPVPPVVGSVVVDHPAFVPGRRAIMETLASGVIDLGVLVVARGRTLSGLVVDAAGRPVANARVELVHDLVAARAHLASVDSTRIPSLNALAAAAWTIRQRPSVTVGTAADGTFTIAGIAPYPAVVRAAHTGRSGEAQVGAVTTFVAIRIP